MPQLLLFVALGSHCSGAGVPGRERLAGHQPTLGQGWAEVSCPEDKAICTGEEENFLEEKTGADAKRRGG